MHHQNMPNVQFLKLQNSVQNCQSGWQNCSSVFSKSFKINFRNILNLSNLSLSLWRPSRVIFSCSSLSPIFTIIWRQALMVPLEPTTVSHLPSYKWWRLLKALYAQQQLLYQMLLCDFTIGKIGFCIGYTTHL